MLGRSCRNLREDSGGVWEGLTVHVFEVRVVGGVLGSTVKASVISSAVMKGL